MSFASRIYLSTPSTFKKNLSQWEGVRRCPSHGTGVTQKGNGDHCVLVQTVLGFRWRVPPLAHLTSLSDPLLTLVTVAKGDPRELKQPSHYSSLRRIHFPRASRERRTRSSACHLLKMTLLRVNPAWPASACACACACGRLLPGGRARVDMTSALHFYFPVN